MDQQSSVDWLQGLIPSSSQHPNEETLTFSFPDPSTSAPLSEMSKTFENLTTFPSSSLDQFDQMDSQLQDFGDIIADTY